MKNSTALFIFQIPISTMKKFLLVTCYLLTVVAYSQPSFTVSDKADAKAIAKSILAVVVEERDEKVVKKLSKKPDELKTYDEGIVKFNMLLKEAIEKEWDFSKEVKFISKIEAEKLKQEKDPNHCLLFLTEVKNYKMGDFYSSPRSGFNSARDLAYHMSSDGRSVALAITQASRPKDEIVVSYLPAVGISKGTMTFMVCNIENQLRDCIDKDVTKFGNLKDEIEKRRPGLQKKTLLIFDPLISNALKKTIDKNELPKYYNYKTEVVSFEKADEIIASKNPDYAYIWVIPAGAVSGSKILFNYFIIDAEDARPMFLTGQAVIGSNGDFHQFHLTKVNKKID